MKNIPRDIVEPTTRKKFPSSFSINRVNRNMYLNLSKTFINLEIIGSNKKFRQLACIIIGLYPIRLETIF